MPQMAPIMWSYLFIYFNLIMMLFIMMNYFMKIYYPSSMKYSLKLLYKLWKL